MVLKIPDRDEAEARSEFSALLSAHSEQVGQIDNYSDFLIWKCGVNQRPNAVGYWIGHLPNFYSFLVLEPIALGGESALEAIRGWTDPERRGQRFFSTLLRTAAREGLPLVSDRNGMTESAHMAWIHASEFGRRYFDTQTNQMFDDANVPSEERFTPWTQGERWLLVLHLK